MKQKRAVGTEVNYFLLEIMSSSGISLISTLFLNSNTKIRFLSFNCSGLVHRRSCTFKINSDGFMVKVLSQLTTEAFPIITVISIFHHKGLFSVQPSGHLSTFKPVRLLYWMGSGGIALINLRLHYWQSSPLLLTNGIMVR